jgi:SprT protein
MADDYMLQRKAQLVANAFAKAYNKKHGTKIPVPVEVSFELEQTDPKCAGMAYHDRLRIGLNMILFRDNVKEFLNQVIPHEVAHLAQLCYERKNNMAHNSHGIVWKSMMASMHKKPDVHHSMDTSKAVRYHKEQKKASKRKKIEE